MTISFLQVTPNYIASGGDGYKFETWKTRDRILGALDTEVRFLSCSAVDTDIIRAFSIQLRWFCFIFWRRIFSSQVLQGVLARESPISAQVEGRIILVIWTLSLFLKLFFKYVLSFYRNYSFEGQSCNFCKGEGGWGGIGVSPHLGPKGKGCLGLRRPKIFNSALQHF